MILVFGGTTEGRRAVKVLDEASLSLPLECVTLARELWDLIPRDRLQAFAHSYIQRRSAGSVMLALSGQGQRGETQAGKLLEQAQRMKFNIANIGIGAGYGYNYVPADGWLLHLSALPTFIVYSNTSLTMGQTEVPLHYHFPEVILTGRGAVVRQLKAGRFVGIQMIFNFTSIGNEERLNIRNDKWLVRAYFGIRLPSAP